MRNGIIAETHHNDLHCGDIIFVEYGMAIPVDGICFSASQLNCNEAAMTGESEEVKKDSIKKCEAYQREKEIERDKSSKAFKISRAHDLPSPILMSGTSVSQGEGKMVSIVVGEYSCLGEIMKKTKLRPEVTPLQNKLE